MTVDVKGNSPLWMKVKDLAEGVTYRFRIRAKTFAYGPDVEANITTGPGEGRGGCAGRLCRGEGGDVVGTVPLVPPGLVWPHASLYPPASSSALGPQVPPVPLASPSSLATARLSPSTGRVGTPAKDPSPDTSSKPVLQVLELLSAFHPYLNISSALDSGETEARSADLSEATRQAGLGIRTQVSGMSAMCRSMRTTLPMLLLSRARRSRCSPSHARGFEGYQGYPKTGRPCSCAGRGRQGWKLGLPIPAAGSQQARPHSLLQPRVNYFSLPQRPQLRRPNRSLTGVGTTPRIGSSPREGNPSLL